MANRTCLGCGIELTEAVVTLEHILPQWLAAEIEMPDVKLQHFRHDEGKSETTLLRAHGLNTYATRQVCSGCNNGWMSRLESQAMPLILSLMRAERSVLVLTDGERKTLSRWAVKTAFMITTSEITKFPMPWEVLYGLGRDEEAGPERCIVFGNQQHNLPKGFLYTNPSDYFSDQATVQVRLGFSIGQLHFVVVVPFDTKPRVARIAAGIHTPLWPLGLICAAVYKPIPTELKTVQAYLYFLTNLIEVGVVTKRTIGLDFVRDAGSAD
jgi:hypothetical protein